MSISAREVLKHYNQWTRALLCSRSVHAKRRKEVMSSQDQTQIIPVGNSSAPDRSRLSFIWRKPSSVDPHANAPKLAPAEGYWLLLKFIIFGLFMVYNVTFFWENTTGWLRYVTCGAAVLLETTAFLCVLWWSRTLGAHRWALISFGIVCILISASHATIAYYQHAPDVQADNWMMFYAHRVAFPLIFGILAAMSIIIPSLHWEKRFIKDQVNHEIQIEKDHARLKANMVKLESKTRLEEAKEKALRKMMAVRTRRLNTVKSMTALREQEEAFIKSISDPVIRAEAQRLLAANQLSLEALDSNLGQNLNLNGQAHSLPN